MVKVSTVVIKHTVENEILEKLVFPSRVETDGIHAHLPAVVPRTIPGKLFVQSQFQPGKVIALPEFLKVDCP